jgi:hypothetical protein
MFVSGNQILFVFQPFFFLYIIHCLFCFLKENINKNILLKLKHLHVLLRVKIYFKNCEQMIRIAFICVQLDAPQMHDENLIHWTKFKERDVPLRKQEFFHFRFKKLSYNFPPLITYQAHAF